MKVVAIWTKMGSNYWNHHWIVKATCAEEALRYVREFLMVPLETKMDEGNIYHGYAWTEKRWRRGGYEVCQTGWAE